MERTVTDPWGAPGVTRPDGPAPGSTQTAKPQLGDHTESARTQKKQRHRVSGQNHPAKPGPHGLTGGFYQRFQKMDPGRPQSLPGTEGGEHVLGMDRPLSPSCRSQTGVRRRTPPCPGVSLWGHPLQSPCGRRRPTLYVHTELRDIWPF